MLNEFEELRNEIRHARIVEKNYCGCIRNCNNYLKTLIKINMNCDGDKRFIFHNLALNNMKLGNINEAMKQELISINYIDQNKCDYDYRYGSSIWLIAECYYLLGNNKEALNLYSQCSKVYKNIGDGQLRNSIIFNKAKIYKNKKAMLQLIKIYEKKNLNSIVTTYGDMEYDDILREMYTDLMTLFVVSNRKDAFKLLNNVKDKNLKRELSIKLVA
jgi:tetratricopeptide (TPR) repeat protein